MRIDASGLANTFGEIVLPLILCPNLLCFGRVTFLPIDKDHVVESSLRAETVKTYHNISRRPKALLNRYLMTRSALANNVRYNFVKPICFAVLR